MAIEVFKTREIVIRAVREEVAKASRIEDNMWIKDRCKYRRQIVVLVLILQRNPLHSSTPRKVLKMSMIQSIKKLSKFPVN